jgi:hypothetical protein
MNVAGNPPAPAHSRDRDSRRSAFSASILDWTRQLPPGGLTMALPQARQVVTNRP